MITGTNLLKWRLLFCLRNFRLCRKHSYPLINVINEENKKVTDCSKNLFKDDNCSYWCEKFHCCKNYLPLVRQPRGLKRMKRHVCFYMVVFHINYFQDISTRSFYLPEKVAKEIQCNPRITLYCIVWISKFESLYNKFLSDILNSSVNIIICEKLGSSEWMSNLSKWLLANDVIFPFSSDCCIVVLFFYIFSTQNSLLFPLL